MKEKYWKKNQPERYSIRLSEPAYFLSRLKRLLDGRVSALGLQVQLQKEARGSELLFYLCLSQTLDKPYSRRRLEEETLSRFEVDPEKLAGVLGISLDELDEEIQGEDLIRALYKQWQEEAEGGVGEDSGDSDECE